MKHNSTRERLLASSMICGVALLGLSATQAAAQQAQQGAEVSEIVVTGSRIPSPNLTSVSPVTAVTQQDIKLQGTATVESMLNRLPQVVASQTSTVANGATGIATVNLRGLGASRTLVLIDGRRLMPGDPAQPVADLNNIPAALVDRVDVLTGGASAVYGSDAIGGVVNFIMNRNFEGFRIDGQYNVFQHDNNNSDAQSILKSASFPIPFPTDSKWDGGHYEITAVMGVNAPDGKGNVTAYVGYRHLNALLESQRDYSACSVITTYSADPTIYDTRACAGSSNSAFGRFRTAATKGPHPTGLSVNPDGSQSFVDYKGAFAFNYGPLNYFQRPEDRYTAGFFAHYDVNDAVKLYSDFMFADDHTVAQIAPSGFFAGTGPSGQSTFKINCDNPLMTAAQQNQLCGAAGGTSATTDVTLGFRFNGQNRQDDLRHTSYRIVIGSKGDLGQGWSYDAYLQYGSTIYSEHYLNDVSVRKAQNALLVDPNTGQCTVDAGLCVPIDVFRLNGLTPAMLGYVVSTGFKSGETIERVASASVTGDLGQYGVKLPWATDGVGVALGTEYRRESLELNVDDAFSSGDLSGQGGPTLANHGGFDVYELFGEARVPIAQDLPFAKNLDLELGYRFSDYSTDAGVTHTYKVGLNYQPIDDLKLRASYNRAVRAPNVVELFSPNAVGLFGGADPCAAGLITGTVKATLQQCQRSGLSAAQYASGIDQCPAAQCSARFGGNLALKAEESDTYTVGFILQPRWLKGFDLSVDYFDIKVDNLITALPQLTLIDCIINGNSSACAKIHRDPATGTVFGQQGFVDATNINTGFLKTNGIDINANYRTNFADWGVGEWGGLNFSFVGTWTDKYEVQPNTGGGTFDCAGLYGPVCSAITNASTGPIPEWKHVFRITWTPPWAPVTISGAWRYISSVRFDGNQSNVFLADPLGRTNVSDDKIDSQNYFDLAGTWKVRDTMTFRFGVNNIFDEDPPIVDSNNFPASGPPYGNANTYPGTYDALGRMIFVGLTADF